jgi:hypothetical protein
VRARGAALLVPAFALTLAALAATAGIVVAALSPGGNEFDPKTERETMLLSTSYMGGFPNGPSRNGVFAQDRQLATYAAFESDASDIIPGDTNNTTDVFLVRRRKPFTLKGEPWRPAETTLVSDGLRGGANGPSYLPDMDGSQRSKPHCVAFVSAASNIVPDDTNGKPDAFVKDLRTGKTQRVSVSSDGEQSDGTTFDVKLDGDCGRVAFTSDASNLALTRTTNRLWRSAVTSKGPPNTRQVYVHVLDDKRDNDGLEGLTFLASASSSGKAGKGPSYDVSFARSGTACPRRCTELNGESVAFTSDARNLSRQDRNGYSDVYLRRFERPYDPKSSKKKRVFPTGLKFRTVYVSETASGVAGNGPSSAPAANDRGDYIAYQTKASNLLPADTNGVQDVARAQVAPKKVLGSRWISRATDGSPLPTAPSGNPTITRPGSPIFYTSDAADVHYIGEHDINGVRDVFFWNIVSRRSSIQSRDSDNRPLGFPPEFKAGQPPILSPISDNPAASYYGNYVLFETSNPLADLKAAEAEMPQLVADPLLAALQARRQPRLQQVYLRYIGPA